MKNRDKTRVTRTDRYGYVLSTKVEDTEWNPPQPIRSGLSRSTAAILSLSVGQVKRIFHPELKCKPNPNTKAGKAPSSFRVCSLQPTIYKMRKQGWKLDYYHEADHVVVIRRLK